MVDLVAIAKATACAAATFAVLDSLWLGLLMSSFYRTQLAPIARLANGGFAPLWTPALLVYLLLSLGTAVFVVPRASSPLAALAFGALFGLVSFGVYDLTNYATLAAWPRVVVLVDMAWGAFACGVAAAVTYTVVR